MEITAQLDSFPTINSLRRTSPEKMRILAGRQARLSGLESGARKFSTDGFKSVVFRLLRPEENPKEGLYPNGGQDSSISLPEHIKKGSRLSSRFISCTKNPLVCHFYASKSIHERCFDPDTLLMVAIQLDIGNAIDLCNTEIRRSHGFSKGSLEDNFARGMYEVVVDGFIPPDDIVAQYRVPKQLPKAKSFKDFQQRLRKEEYSSGQALPPHVYSEYNLTESGLFIADL